MTSFLTLIIYVITIWFSPRWTKCDKIFEIKTILSKAISIRVPYKAMVVKWTE